MKIPIGAGPIRPWLGKTGPALTPGHIKTRLGTNPNHQDTAVGAPVDPGKGGAMIRNRRMGGILVAWMVVFAFVSQSGPAIGAEKEAATRGDLAGIFFL